VPPVNFRYHTLACQSMNRLALLSRPIARIGLIVELDRISSSLRKTPKWQAALRLRKSHSSVFQVANGEFLPARLCDSEVCALVSFPYLALTC
jgi:hypothetical protein